MCAARCSGESELGRRRSNQVELTDTGAKEELCRGYGDALECCHWAALLVLTSSHLLPKCLFAFSNRCCDLCAARRVCPSISELQNAVLAAQALSSHAWPMKTGWNVDDYFSGQRRNCKSGQGLRCCHLAGMLDCCTGTT